MKRTVLSILTLTLLIAANAFGQAKVGTTGAQFLNLPFSLRSSAMGDVATVFVDRQAYAANPGSIGLIAARSEISFGPLSWGKDILGGSADSYSGGTLVSVLRPDRAVGQKVSLGLAGYSTALKGELSETSYQRIPTGTVAKWSDHAYHLLAGLGIDGPLQVGLGAGITYFRESAGLDTSGSAEYSADGWSVDFGLVARVPITLNPSTSSSQSSVTLTPSAGVAVTNVGPSLNFIANDYPLARLLRTGFGSELAINTRRYFGGWWILSAAAAIEYEKERNYDGFTKVGAELGLGEALYLRIGHSGDGSGTDTWGFAVRSSGLTRLLLWAFGDPSQLSSTAEFFASRLTIEYAQSNATPAGWNRADILHGFTLTYRYGGL